MAVRWPATSSILLPVRWTGRQMWDLRHRIAARPSSRKCHKCEATGDSIKFYVSQRYEWPLRKINTYCAHASRPSNEPFVMSKSLSYFWITFEQNERPTIGQRTILWWRWWEETSENNSRWSGRFAARFSAPIKIRFDRFCGPPIPLLLSHNRNLIRCEHLLRQEAPSYVMTTIATDRHEIYCRIYSFEARPNQ